MHRNKSIRRTNKIRRGIYTKELGEKYNITREELIDKGWIIIQGSSIYNRKPTYYSKRMLTPYQKLFLKPLIENNEIVEVDIC